LSRESTFTTVRVSFRYADRLPNTALPRPLSRRPFPCDDAALTRSPLSRRRRVALSDLAPIPARTRALVVYHHHPVAPMSRTVCSPLVAIGLAHQPRCSLVFREYRSHKDIRSYIASHYQKLSRRGGTGMCHGSPTHVADNSPAPKPAARANNAGTPYCALRRCHRVVGATAAPVQHPRRGPCRRLQPWRVQFLAPWFYPFSIARRRWQHRGPGRNQNYP